MAIAADLRTNGGKTTSAGATSLSWNHTVGASLSNSILVGFGTESSAGNASISTFQWDAAVTPVAMTRKGRINDSALISWAEAWYLLAPAAGLKSVKITPTASAQLTGGSASYSGVDQTTPFNAASPQTATGTATATQPSVAVTSAVGELVVACVTDDENSTNDTLVVGASQTAIHNQAIGAGFMSGASSDKAGAASVTMSYTGVGSTNTWGIVGASLRPAAAAGAYALRRMADVDGIGGQGIMMRRGLS